MANRQTIRHFVSLFLFFSVTTLRAQSLSDLEKELLLGEGGAAEFVEPEETPAEAPPAAVRNSRRTPAPTPPPTAASSDSAGDLLEDFAKEDAKASDYVYGDDERKDLEESALEDIDEAIAGPKQIPFDHILVVKHRYVNKAERFELAPITISLQPADSFRKQFGVGMSMAYHFSEDFALEFLHASFTTNYRSSLEEDINKQVSPKLGFERVEPVLTLGSAIWWSPFKGKSSTIENIYHWEAYFLGGGGATRTEVAFAGMAMFGAGARLYLNKRAILRLEVRDYYDFTKNGDHRVNILAGASVLFGED